MASFHNCGRTIVPFNPDLASRRYPELEILVTQEAVENFFKSVGYPFEPQEEIPHSFYACLREGEFKIFESLEIDLHQLLHVSQSFSYYKHYEWR
ncbi:MAG: hypothetical protein R3A80_09500 [Bdellovibrionota bacterium]